jgi:uncharacterized membrane protein
MSMAFQHAEQGVKRENKNFQQFASRERQNGQQKNGTSEILARTLGWFSIGLGLAEASAPGTLAKFIGIKKPRTSLFRALGVREIASGVGILTQSKTSGWLWSRVAGDVMDLSLLGLALKSNRSKHGRLGFAAAAVAGVTALDIFSSRQFAREEENGKTAKDRILHVEKAITIRKSPEEIYRFWRDFKNLPRFMRHLESITVINEKRSHWKAKAPAGKTIEWNAEITQEIPNELIAWRSDESDEVKHSGEVRFERAPGARGTEVHVDFQYDPPAGALGAVIAKLLGEDPQTQVQEDLRRFKQLLEAGEIPTTKGQPSGSKKILAMKQK